MSEEEVMRRQGGEEEEAESARTSLMMDPLPVQLPAVVGVQLPAVAIADEALQPAQRRKRSRAFRR